jgi:hypothetical protein
MEFKIFVNKKIGDGKLFLAQPTMLFGSLNPEDYVMVAKHIVKDDDLVRPDRIATEHYGTTSGLDIILKFNGISDPFSINVGEELWIPMDTIPYFRLESPQMYEDNPIKNQFIKTKRLSKTDQRRLKALKKKYNKENLLPPNVIPVGRKNYEFDGSNIRFGMGPQTDAVVDSILSDIRNQDKFDNSSDEEATVAELIIDANDNSQLTNSSGNGSGSGNGGGSGKLYEDLLSENSGVVQTERGSGTGSGTANGTGSGNGGGSGRTDTADNVGGDEPDGTAPGNADNNPTNNPDAPCSK